MLAAINLFTLLAVAATFVGFYFTVRQYDLQQAAQRDADTAKRRADTVLLQQELQRNYDTAEYVIKAWEGRKAGKTQIPLTVFTDDALQRMLLTDVSGDTGAYFNLIALKKLFVSSNRLLDNVMQVHSMHLTAIVEQQPKVDVVLDEQLEMLRQDAENIKLKIRELNPWINSRLK